MNTPKQKPEAVNPATAVNDSPATAKDSPATDANDSFPDLSKLRLSQEFLETAGAKKILTTVPVRKPNKQEFVRVHPGAEFREAFAVIELKEDREHYLIMPDIAAALSTEIVTVMLYTVINRQRVVSLWPVRLPASDGRVIEWHRSAQEAAECAMGRWIRVVPNMSLGANEVIEATAKMPDPEWPKYSFHELLRIGFRDRIISSLDHPVLKRLRGEC
jgi:hypothetical protein